MAGDTPTCSECGQELHGMKRSTFEAIIGKVVDEKFADKDLVTFNVSEAAKEQVRRYVKNTAAILTIPLVVLGWFGITSVMDVIRIRDDLRKSAVQIQDTLEAVNSRAIRLEGNVADFEKRTGTAYQQIAALISANKDETASSEKAAASLRQQIEDMRRKK